MCVGPVRGLPRASRGSPEADYCTPGSAKFHLPKTVSKATSEKLVVAQAGLLGTWPVFHLYPVNPKLSLSVPAARLDLASLPKYKSACQAFFYESNAFWVHLNPGGEDLCRVGVDREAWCLGTRKVVATGLMA